MRPRTGAAGLVESDKGNISRQRSRVSFENGEIAIGKLSPDTYTVTEIETVDGYVKDA